jgi:quinol monooxygenase YgiN
MHVQIVTFSLRDISDADYRSACEGLANIFADLPGLISMIWLADRATNTYGGVYTWLDRAAMEAYVRSDIFLAIAADPDLADITSRDFEILEGPTRVTQAQAVPAA